MSPDTLPHKINLDLKFGTLRGTLQWCRNSCQDEWACKIIDETGSDPGKYEFYFKNEHDLINFILYNK
jgi:hypothetical protein